MRGKGRKNFPKSLVIIKSHVERQVIKIEKKPENSVYNGVYEAISELIGSDNTIKLYEHFRGSQVNFPTRLFSKEFVLREALRCYDGTSESINTVAVKYGYSERTIRKLLKQQLDSL